MNCILSINATFLKVLRKWSRVVSRLIISTIILTTFVRMNHFDLLPLLELNFLFESVRLFAYYIKLRQPKPASARVTTNKVVFNYEPR